MAGPGGPFQLLLVTSTWAMFAPQVVRSLRRGAEGVSAEGWAAIAASRAVMLLYGLAVDDAAQIWSAAVPGMLSLVVLFASLRGASRRDRWRVALWACVTGTVAAASSGTAGDAAVSVALVVGAGLSALPHVRRIRISDSAEGVSVPAWVASLLSSCAWVAHGVMQGLPAVILANLIWTAASYAVVSETLKFRAGTAGQRN